MRKKLYLIRHAKSSWESIGMSDWERPLNDRGLRDGPRMAQYCQQHFQPPHTVLSSDSLRTRSTAQYLISSGWVPEGSIQFFNDLYMASAEDIFHRLTELPQDVSTAAIVAHNPGIYEALLRLSQDFAISKFPTCGIAQLVDSSDLGTWHNLDHRPWHLESFVYPRKLYPVA
jgi:phosphohistidine phosphatase